MRVLPPVLLIVPVLLAACATTRMSEPEKLALYTSHAGAPVRSIPYRTPIGWEKVDDSNVLVTTRPTEAWLLRLAPNCFAVIGAGPSISISSQAGFVTAGFDEVTGNTTGASIPCRIEEIRQVDLAAVRSARKAMEASAP